MPVQLALPDINTDRLDSLDEDTFWSLMERELSADWAFEMQAMLAVLYDSPV